MPYEDETVVAFMDSRPVTPAHLPESCRSWLPRDAPTPSRAPSGGRERVGADAVGSHAGSAGRRQPALTIGAIRRRHWTTPLRPLTSNPPPVEASALEERYRRAAGGF